jgi:hypothetical protein
MADFVDTFFNSYGGNTTGMTDASYVNKVYVGTQKVKGSTTQSPTGTTYNIPDTTKDKVETIAAAKTRYLTDAELRKKWNVALRKNGIDADPIQARAIWDLSVDGASDWYATSGGQQKITPEQYLGWYAGGKKKKGPALPTRQVYQVPEAETDADINEFLQKRAGRTLQDVDRSQEWYKDLVKSINKLYSEGIVTTVAQVKNPQTGKMEKVVTQTPGFSKEQVAQKITSAIEKADPISVARKQNLELENWARAKMAGNR